jgi:signal transduction histidine kinase
MFIFAAMGIAVASVFYSNELVKTLAQEEQQKMKIWAMAQQVLASKDTDMNMSLVSEVIVGNTTIPMIWCDENDSIIFANNISGLSEKDTGAYIKKKLQELKAKNQVITIDFNDGTFQYLYYDDSIILKRLNIYPYAQLMVIFAFILISLLALANIKRAEQNKVWVGLSKETAHQLGTPISSLIAWMEYLRTKEIAPSLLTEMEKDVKRLETIAERFSKIGSNPDPTPVDINHSIRQALDYMATRISPKVKLLLHLSQTPALALMNDALFAWVIENLVKNAVDAMEGQGTITFRLETNAKHICIDISDTGKGIPKSKFDLIFTPGYTTKTRGWGLGLSLVRRIIESYHGGKIFVKSSETGKGTTFRIELRKYKG